MSNNYITGIVQDPKGYIWISTYRGLNRFDGSNFKQLLSTGDPASIPDNSIYSIQMLPNGELAISTESGAQIITTQTLQAKNLYIPTEEALRYWSHSAQYINKDDDGNYGVSTKTGFYIFSPTGKLKKRFDHYSVKDVGHSWMLFGSHVYKLPDGNMLQENSDGLNMYDRKKNIIKSVSSDYPGLQQAGLKSEVNFFFLSAYKLLKLDEVKNCFDILDIRTGKTRSFPACFNISEEFNWQTKLCRLNDSTYILNSRKKGFYAVHIDTSLRSVTCSPKKYLSDYFCNVIFLDQQKKLWVGTNEGLLMERPCQKIVDTFSLSLKKEKENNVSSLFITRDKIYVGTGQKEVFILDKQTRKVIRYLLLDTANAPTKTVRSFLPVHPDTLWIGTASGLMWLHTGNYSRGYIESGGLSDKYTVIKTLFMDTKKNRWIGVNYLNNIVHYNAATRSFSRINENNNPLLKINQINSFAEDKDGNVWIGGDAIARWNSRKQQVDTLIEYLSTQENKKRAFGVMSDENGDIWTTAFDDGVAKLTGTGAARHLRNESLKADNASWISPALFRDKIYLLTFQNICFVNTRTGQTILFNYADGIPEKPITSRFFSYDSTDGSTWFACRNVICRIPANVNINRSAPELNISEVSLFNDTLINFPPPTIIFEHDQNDISISLGAVNFTDPLNMRFSYRIKNQRDTSWIETGTQQNIFLNNTSPGEILLEARVAAFDNRWTAQTKNLRIIILSPYWKTSWFLALLTLAGFTAAFLLYKWRIRQVKNAEKEKLHVQQLKAEEYKTRMELEQISNYFSSLTGKKNKEEILWDVIRNLIGHMNYVDCMIYLWNADKTKMIQKACYGPKGSPEALASQVFDVMPGQGVVGYVMQTLKPVLIADTRKDSRYRVDEMSRLSEICVPVIHDGELLGIIDSEHHELNYYKERDLKILTTIATLIGNKVKQIESEETLEVKQEELASINQQLAEAQLSALQTQMNPHFIFNALNSIKRMILENHNQKASRYLSKFALMIRLTLDHSKETFVTLRETVTYLGAYLEMEQLRFDESFTYEIKADEDIDEDDIIIPSLMIQPLVENAIWHGLMLVEGEKKVLIRFSQYDDKIFCSIEDNGIGIQRSVELKRKHRPLHKSVGLKNLRGRMKIMNEKYNADCTLEITDLQEMEVSRTGTLAVLSFKSVIL